MAVRGRIGATRQATLLRRRPLSTSITAALTLCAVAVLVDDAATRLTAASASAAEPSSTPDVPDDTWLARQVLPYTWEEFVSDCGRAARQNNVDAVSAKFREKYHHEVAGGVVEWTGHGKVLRWLVTHSLVVCSVAVSVSGGSHRHCTWPLLTLASRWSLPMLCLHLPGLASPVWDVQPGRKSGLMKRPTTVRIKMDPSDAWMHDLGLTIDEDVFPVHLFTPKAGITFRAALLSHSRSYLDHTLELKEIVVLYDGVHDTRHVFAQRGDSGSGSGGIAAPNGAHPADFVGHTADAAVLGSSWPEFVRLCGTRRAHDNPEAAEDDFEAVFKGRTIRWAGRVLSWPRDGEHHAPNSEGWLMWSLDTGLRTLAWAWDAFSGSPDHSAAIAAVAKGRNVAATITVKMRPSNAWVSDLKLVAFDKVHDDVLERLAGQAVNADGSDLEGEPTLAELVMGLSRGEDIWFSAQWIAFGGEAGEHVLELLEIERVPAALASGHSRWEL